MLTNCLPTCAHLTIIVSEIERDIGRKSSIFSYPPPLHSTPPLGGFPSQYRHPLGRGKTRMVSIPDGAKISKISLFVLAQLTNVTDGQTDRQTDRHTPGDSKDRAYASHRAVKMVKMSYNYAMYTVLTNKHVTFFMVCSNLNESFRQYS